MFEMISRILIVVSLVSIVPIGILKEYHVFKNYHYQCIKCFALYKPDTLWKSMCGTGGLGQKKHRCPGCGKREWANMIKGEIAAKTPD